MYQDTRHPDTERTGTGTNRMEERTNNRGAGVSPWHQPPVLIGRQSTLFPTQLFPPTVKRRICSFSSRKNKKPTTTRPRVVCFQGLPCGQQTQARSAWAPQVSTPVSTRLHATTGNISVPEAVHRLRQPLEDFQHEILHLRLESSCHLTKAKHRSNANTAIKKNNGGMTVQHELA